MRNYFVLIFCIIQIFICEKKAYSQKDTAVNEGNHFLKTIKKELIGKISESISIANVPEDTVIKNDVSFQRYEGLIIRNIFIQEVNFGSSIYNTTQVNKNFVTRIADQLHSKTKENIIRKNLYFKEGDAVFPFLISDNERFLRELPYLQDVRIKLLPDTTYRFVDIFIIVKDVLSLGVNFSIQNVKSGELELKDENLFGYGDKIIGKVYYDNSRKSKIGKGISFTKRNILGTFTDLTMGYQDYQPAFNSGKREETIYSVGVNRPLVNAYSTWTYNLTAAYHLNVNQYFGDSIFKNEQKYDYQELDLWAAYNLGSKNLLNPKNSNRVRKYIAGRFFNSFFYDLPTKYYNEYNKLYADIIGILGSFTISRQEFYKARFIYGFGRNEDIPEGYNFSVIGGFTDKAQRNRNYVGVEYQKNKFNSKGHYFNYGAKFSTFIYQDKLEDITFFTNLEYFSRLMKINETWNHRLFLSSSFTRLGNLTLHDPLVLKSNYGLLEFNNGNITAELRATFNGEVVFFNKWSLYGFKFAPFLFAGTSFLTPSHHELNKTEGYSSIGMGIRSRNENLIFGTMQLKAFYFPRITQGMTTFKLDFVTNLRYRYSSNFVHRPEFLEVN